MADARLLRGLRLLLVVAALLPASLVLTLLLLPLWRWIESRYGIESVGHSGPASWCYFAIYAVALMVALILALRPHRQAGGSG